MSGIRNNSEISTANLSESDIISLLDQCNTEIARLESELEKQRYVKTTLENAHSSLRGARSALSHIPEEILVYIFSEVMRDDPQAIGPILFVCRLWNRVACDTPMLWTNIVSKPEATPESIIRGTKYLESAIRYSGSLPLDVTLHLISRADVWEDMAKKIWPSPPSHHVDYRAYQDILKRERMIEWFRDAVAPANTYNGEIMEKYCARTFEIMELYLKHINTFVPKIQNEPESGNEAEGVNSEDGSEDEQYFHEYVDRIRSLEIHLDSYYYEKWAHTDKENLFKLFRPRPERVTIIDRSPILFHDYFAAFSVPNPNLRFLSWRASYPVRRFVREPGRLIHLCLFWKYFPTSPLRTNIPTPEFTPNLRYLFLYGSMDLEPTDTIFDRRVLLFPQLEDLALAGIYHKSIFEAISAPRLLTLRILDVFATEILREIPPQPTIPFHKITRFHIQDYVYVEGKYTLEELLEIAPAIQELGIVGPVVDDVKACMLQIEDQTGRDGFSIKGFRYSSDDYWSFDSYDHNEITISS